MIRSRDEGRDVKMSFGQFCEWKSIDDDDDEVEKGRNDEREDGMKREEDEKMRKVSGCVR